MSRRYKSWQGGSCRRHARRISDSIVVTNLALMIASSVGLIITARYLGVVDRGLYLTWSSWCAMIGTQAMLGTQAFIVVAAGRLNVRVSVPRLSAMLMIGIVLASSCAFAAMTWLNAGPVAVLGGVLLAISGPIVATHAAVQQANGHHGWRFNAARALSPIAGLFSVVFTLILLRPGPQELFLALGLGCLTGAIISVGVAHEVAAAKPQLIAGILQLARRGSLLVLLGWLILNFDTVVVSIAGRSSDVSIYGVGAAARSVVLAIGMAVGMRWFATRERFGSFKSVIRPFLPAVAAALGIAVVAPMAVPLVLGQDFAPSVPVVQLQAVGGVLASADFLLSHVLLVRSGYAWPTILRLALVLTLTGGIIAVRGRPIYSSAVFCSVMLMSVIAQIWIARLRKGWR